MKRLEVSGVVRPIYRSLGVKRLRKRGDARLLCHKLHDKHSDILTLLFFPDNCELVKNG